MRVNKWLRLGTLALVVIAGWPENGEASKRRFMERKLEPLDNDDASATTSVRFISLGSPHLVTSQIRQRRFSHSLRAIIDDTRAGELKSAPATADNLPATATLPGPPPEWDALAHGDGSIAVVWTVAGSAVSHLSYKNRKNATALTVNSGTPFAVFVAPHFVGGTKGDSIVAVALLPQSEPMVVVFRQKDDGAFEKYKPIEVSWRGIPADARLVQISDGYVLFAKVIPPGGQIQNAPARRLFGSEMVQPGWLEVILLDADLQPTRPAVSQFNSDVVFELDAVSFGRRIALLTTTRTGSTLGLWNEEGRPMVDAGRSRNESPQGKLEVQFASAGPLTSPSLLFLKEQLYIAAIRDVGPTARVVTAKVELSSL
jgi:hypothetical protein